MGGQVILGLHAVNGLAILAVSIVLFVRARRFAATSRVPASPAAPASESAQQDPVAS